jgi:hypothetical protein
VDISWNIIRDKNRRNICKEVEGKGLKKGEIVLKHLGTVTMLNDVTKEI